MKINKIITIACILSAPVLANAKGYVVGVTTDLNKAIAGGLYGLTQHAFNIAEEGDTISVVSMTGRPGLVAKIEKGKYGNRNAQKTALKPFEAKIIGFLKDSLKASEGDQVTAHLDIPRFIRSMGNFMDEGDHLILVGSPLWMGKEMEYHFINTELENEGQKFRRPTHGSITANKFLSPFSIDEVETVNGDVLWWNPMGDAYSGPDSYSESVSDFWTVMFGEVGLKMLPMQTEVVNVANMMGSNENEYVSAQLKNSEAGVRMITLDELRPRLVVTKQAQPKFNVLHLVDNSGSQRAHLESIARKLSEMRGQSGVYHGLVLFDAGTAALYSENANVLEIARAFRQAPTLGGADYPGSFSAGLKIALDECRSRNARSVTINIVSDVAPVMLKGKPPHLQYPYLIEQLLSDGHKVVFVKTNHSLDTSFLPFGVEVRNF